MTIARPLAGTTPLPDRRGDRPRTTAETPHEQLDQISPVDLQQELWDRMRALPHVLTGRSMISMPDTVALHLRPEYAHGPRQAFAPTGGTEFAHLHGTDDGSLHIYLPEATARDVIAKGWGEWHPAVRMGWVEPTVIMVYGPRDRHELETISGLVVLSHRFATEGY